MCGKPPVVEPAIAGAVHGRHCTTREGLHGGAGGAARLDMLFHGVHKRILLTRRIYQGFPDLEASVKGFPVRSVANLPGLTCSGSSPLRLPPTRNMAVADRRRMEETAAGIGPAEHTH